MTFDFLFHQVPTEVLNTALKCISLCFVCLNADRQQYEAT